MLPMLLLLFAIIVFAGAGLIVLIRRLLDSKFPLASAYIAVLGPAMIIFLVTPLVGLERPASYPLILIATFLGTHWTQPHPWSVQGLCRALAAASGIVAIVAIVNWAPTTIALSVGVTGGLVYLSSLDEPK